MHSIVKVRTAGINGRPTRFVDIPQTLTEKVRGNYMAISMDEMGRRIYTTDPKRSMKNNMLRGSGHCFRPGELSTSNDTYGVYNGILFMR